MPDFFEISDHKCCILSPVYTLPPILMNRIPILLSIFERIFRSPIISTVSLFWFTDDFKDLQFNKIVFKI